MSEIQTELQRINNIWREIQAYEASEFEAEKNECRRRFEAVSQSLTAAAQRKASATAPASEAEMALSVLDVMDFVLGATEFYRKLRTIRPFTPGEKAVGESLTALMQHCDDIVATFENSPKRRRVQGQSSVETDSWTGAAAPHQRAS